MRRGTTHASISFHYGAPQQHQRLRGTPPSIHPDVPVDGHGCYTAQSSCVEDVFFFENVCELATDPLHPRPDQTGQHAAVLYDLYGWE